MLLRKFIRNSLLPGSEIKPVKSSATTGNELNDFNFIDKNDIISSYKSIYDKYIPSNFEFEKDVYDDEYSYGIIENKYYDYVYYMDLKKNNKNIPVKKSSTNNKMNIYRDLLYVLHSVNAIFKDAEDTTRKLDRKEEQEVKKRTLKVLKDNGVYNDEEEEDYMDDRFDGMEPDDGKNEDLLEEDDGPDGNVYDEVDEIVDKDERNQSQRNQIMCVFLDHLYSPDARDMHLYDRTDFWVRPNNRSRSPLPYPRFHTRDAAPLARLDPEKKPDDSYITVVKVPKEISQKEPMKILMFLFEARVSRTIREFCEPEKKEVDKNEFYNDLVLSTSLTYSFDPYEYHEIHYILLQCMSLQLLKIVYHHIFIVIYEHLRISRVFGNTKNENKRRGKITRIIEEIIGDLEFCDLKEQKEQQDELSAYKQLDKTPAFKQQDKSLSDTKKLPTDLIKIIKLWWRCSSMREVVIIINFIHIILFVISLLHPISLSIKKTI
jgi:hypothetical protein